MEPIRRFPLGRNQSPPDARDYRLADYIMFRVAYPVVKNKAWDFFAAPLDQGQTGHCVGFSGADWGINLPVQDAYTNQDGHAFYYKCKIVDGEPGQENGSNVRSIGKVLQDAHKLETYAFAGSIAEIKYWLINHGPLIVGTNWTDAMFTPDKNNIIHKRGAVAGGHAYILNELKDNKYFGIQNSWGEWGVHGKAYISICDFSKLFRAGGEALAAVELPLVKE